MNVESNASNNPRFVLEEAKKRPALWRLATLGALIEFREAVTIEPNPHSGYLEVVHTVSMDAPGSRRLRHIRALRMWRRLCEHHRRRPRTDEVRSRMYADVRNYATAKKQKTQNENTNNRRAKNDQKR